MEKFGSLFCVEIMGSSTDQLLLCAGVCQSWASAWHFSYAWIRSTLTRVCGHSQVNYHMLWMCIGTWHFSYAWSALTRLCIHKQVSTCLNVHRHGIFLMRQVNYSILGRLIDRMGGGFFQLFHTWKANRSHGRRVFSAIYACVIAIDENLTTADASSVPTC